MRTQIFQNSQRCVRITGWGLFLLDALLTYYAIRYLHATEGNPVVHMVMDRYGVGMGLTIITAMKCLAWAYLSAVAQPLAIWTWWVYAAILGGSWVAYISIPTQ